MNIDSNQMNYVTFKKKHIVEEAKISMSSLNQIHMDKSSIESKIQIIDKVNEPGHQQLYNFQTTQKLEGLSSASTNPISEKKSESGHHFDTPSTKFPSQSQAKSNFTTSSRIDKELNWDISTEEISSN